MAAKNVNEVFNFVNKFLDLSRTGKNANLSLQCQDGRVVLNLQLQLPTYPPPQYHPRQPSHPYPRASPSRVRRSLRRADARAKKAENDALKYPSKPNTTEQVATESFPTLCTAETVDKAEQASKSQAKVSHHHPVQFPAGQAGQAAQALEDVQHQSQEAASHQSYQEVSKPQHATTDIELPSITEIMEDLKNNFSAGLRETVRNAVREGFKPP